MMPRVRHAMVRHAMVRQSWSVSPGPLVLVLHVSPGPARQSGHVRHPSLVMSVIPVWSLPVFHDQVSFSLG